MKKENPLVSIIVPNYNHEKYLGLRLESIFNQTYPNFEVILLDDCSTDNSREILLEYAKNKRVSHCLFNATNSGNTFVQWNKGIELAKGDYIWIAESDDFCELHFLEELIQPFLQDPEIKLVYCQSNKADKMGNITGSWLHHTENLDTSLFLTNFVMSGNEFIERFLIHKNVIPNASGVLFTKKSAVRLGNLDLDLVLKTCGDWLFYLKLVTNNKVAFIPKSLNNFRYHSQSVIASTIETESLGSIIDIDLKNRKKMIDFLSVEKPNNLSVILTVNTQIVKELKYKKGLFCFRNDEKLKGGLLMCSVLDVFIKNYKFKENFKLKCNRFFK
ncbi:glycosyltransferase family 2 protein [Flavobacterium yafengii]|uniref:glycosyltransferase family 2 protein n=1 Tax=Flavobacterium yafengii TaxID=3041253 RepID=UPI0024A9023A|nr:glycosyltransferase family 2 protein [Flavobacterium yafengii]MDI6046615.1 glycosyltransferase family 2 protein [Flavobacterium yafengii]